MPSVIRANLSAHNSVHIHIYLNKHCPGFELCSVLMDELIHILGWVGKNNLRGEENSPQILLHRLATSHAKLEVGSFRKAILKHACLIAALYTKL